MAGRLSRQLYHKALSSIPAGVNSPVRAFNAVDCEPLFIDRGKGAYLFDADGNKYVDFIQSWGASILGHSHPIVIDAIQSAANKGTSFGLSTAMESELAELVKRAYPSIELLRMVNSGTEAVMTAVRLARGYTKRNKIIKFEGCYHGHGDCLLAKAGSGLATLGISDSAGVPDSIASQTIVVPYNDIEAVKEAVSNYPDDIAGIIVEPVAANMGVVLPKQGFLESLREICNSFGAVLIFDEVITGFRIAPGGAQEIYGVKADLTTLGKIICGGLPVGAVGAKTEIMEQLAPNGPVYQAGTLSGNPVVVSVGIAVLNYLFETNPYSKLDRLGESLEKRLKKSFNDVKVPACINRAGSMLTIFFCEDEVIDFTATNKSSTSLYASFFKAMLDAGILLPPSQFEAIFMSTEHTTGEIINTAEAIKTMSPKCLH